MHFSNIHLNSTFHLTVNFFSDLCTKHSQESSYELVIESKYQFLTGGCVKHYFSVSDKFDLLYINHFLRYEVAFAHGDML